jgi:hypothetical protein
MPLTSDDRTQILASLPPSERLWVETAWDRTATVGWLLAHQRRYVVRHARHHPSFVAAVLRWWWVTWRLDRALHGRLGTTRSVRLG